MVTRQGKIIQANFQVYLFLRTFLVVLLIGLSTVVDFWWVRASTGSEFGPDVPGEQPADQTLVYLPLVMVTHPPTPTPQNPLVNVPYFEGDILGEQTAVFWFGASWLALC